MNRRLLKLAILPLLVLIVFSFATPVVQQQDALTGAWKRVAPTGTEVMTFTDGYYSYSAYDQDGRKFHFTTGGPYRLNGDKLEVQTEYDTRQADRVGTTTTIPFSIAGTELTITTDGGKQTWQRVDAGDAPLAGAWQITQRMQDGSLQTIHQTGTRKTVKLLTGSRFQWVAIDPGAKGFYGTGGGRYTFKDGKYTEHIEFFSRDSSRVGASLEFNGKLENGNWHHSGKSSRGDNIYEVWSRGKK